MAKSIKAKNLNSEELLIAITIMQKICNILKRDNSIDRWVDNGEFIISLTDEQAITLSETYQKLYAQYFAITHLQVGGKFIKK
jgi:hypothetical protein